MTDRRRVRIRMDTHVVVVDGTGLHGVPGIHEMDPNSRSGVHFKDAHLTALPESEEPRKTLEAQALRRLSRARLRV